MTDSGPPLPRDGREYSGSSRSTTGIFLVAGIIALVSLGIASPYALVSVLFDAAAVLVVLFPPVLLGVAVVPFLGLGNVSRSWRILIGAALGLGALSTLVFLFGLLGWLQRPVWVAIVCIETVGGVIALRLGRKANDSNDSAVHEHETRNAELSLSAGVSLDRLWLIVFPFLVLAILATSNAPGFIWKEEGYGYDVLEYHLQIPKEYYQAGRISYLPHNVYANFPSAMEMLYLLNMILQGDTVGTATSANLIHFSFALLTVYAAWVFGSLWSRRVGVVSSVTIATTGWLCYLSGLAYVENGMLFFGFAATAALLSTSWNRSKRDISVFPRQTRRRHVALAGLFVGFACGCKYTALPMIAGPLLVASLLLPRQALREKLENGLIFALLTTVSFSPWLIHNTVTTGNPVFPLANQTFGATPSGWGSEQTDRWERSHEPDEHEKTFVGRFRALWRHIPADRYQRFGPAVILLGFIGLLGRKRDRIDLVLIVILCLQIMVWLFATHLYARFTVVFLIPLTMLAGRSVLVDGPSRRSAALILLLCAGAGWNFYFAADLIRTEKAFGGDASLFYNGKLPGYEYFKIVNQDLPEDARILLIGEARAFYFQRRVSYNVVFNRNPFAQIVRNAESEREILEWLIEEGYTHVLVNWLEIGRLRASYGFADEIDESLFERLVRAGLSPLRHYDRPGTNERQVSVYEIPRG